MGKTVLMLDVSNQSRFLQKMALARIVQATLYQILQELNVKILIVKMPYKYG